MGYNGYQGQIRAMDQPNGYFIGGNSQTAQEIFTLIQQDTSITTAYVEKIGIQTYPGTLIRLNGQTIEIGKTGMYETDEVEITSIQFPENSPKNVIIDYIAHKG